MLEITLSSPVIAAIVAGIIALKGIDKLKDKKKCLKDLYKYFAIFQRHVNYITKYKIYSEIEYNNLVDMFNKFDEFYCSIEYEFSGSENKEIVDFINYTGKFLSSYNHNLDQPNDIRNHDINDKKDISSLPNIHAEMRYHLSKVKNILRNVIRK